MRRSRFHHPAIFTGVHLALPGIVFMAIAPCLLAQVATGRIGGTVTDTTGAVIPGVTVTITNAETSVVQTAQSGNSGEYVFTAVNPGTYTLKAEAPVFSVLQAPASMHISRTT
jgi:protocatechuate 3,4-dioxygenase beta subunit